MKKKILILIIFYIFAIISNKFLLPHFQLYLNINIFFNFFSQWTDTCKLKKNIVLKQKWVAFPHYNNRSAWDRFFGSLKTQYINRGKKRLTYNWYIRTASNYIKYDRDGSGGNYGDDRVAIADLLIAELAEGKGQFIDKLIDGLFFSCECTSWALPSHLMGLQPSHSSLPTYDYHVIDLFSSDFGALVSWAHFFLHEILDKINPEISRRLCIEVKKRILQPYIEDGSFWWIGRKLPIQFLNNWNPYCNSNVLMCFLLIENDLDQLCKGVKLTLDSINKYLNFIKYDGGCEEGSTYWDCAAGKLLDYLDILSLATNHQIEIFHLPLIKHIGEFISRSYVGNFWIVNFADAFARIDCNPHLIFRYGKAISSVELLSFASQLYKLNASSTYYQYEVFRTLSSISIHEELSSTNLSYKRPSFTWYPLTELCYISKFGMFLAAKGGNNDESHNHNDVGSFSLWYNKIPIFIDAGVGTYTKQTFSSQRYSLWNMQSEWHNLPLINGISQKNGKQYKASSVKAQKFLFKSDISSAYPIRAEVIKWIRSYHLSKKGFVINDFFRLKRAFSSNIINFLTWGRVMNFSQPGAILIQVQQIEAILEYDHALFDLLIVPNRLTDSRFKKNWGETIYKLSFKAKQFSTKGNYSFKISFRKVEGEKKGRN